MRQLVLLCLIFFPVLRSSAQEPPRLLPKSITGKAPEPMPAVTPVSGTQSNAAVPIARFENGREFPRETLLVLAGAKAGADWLWRMNQSTGRFLPGLNPTTRTGLSSDPDVDQATATLALVEAARFTGEARLRVRAEQAVLTLLTRTRPDPEEATRRRPTTSTESLEFAATLTLAILQLPDSDRSLLNQAEELTRYVQHQLPTLKAAKPDTLGLTVECLAVSHRLHPADWKREAISKVLSAEVERFRSKPDTERVAMLLPGLVEFALSSSKLDPTLTATIFEMADWLRDRQYTRSDARNPAWIGGFRTDEKEPTWASAACARALAETARLTRHVPDLSRFRTYRDACLGGLTFVGSLQFTDETANQFEPSFRQRYMIGAVHRSPSDGVLQLEATATATRAYLTFLQSGAEGRTD